MSRLLAAFVCVGCALIHAPAMAYTVGSGFSDRCHEQLTVDAYLGYAIDLPTERVPIPDSETWRQIGGEILDSLGVEVTDERYALVVASLVIGVRSPDTNGHGILDFDSVRLLHLSPEGQYVHALRAIDDDGSDGNTVALAGIRAQILGSVDEARRYAALPPEEQIIEVDVYLEFYGTVKVEVWAVAYHLGRAMHTLQDSFSHTIRSDDLFRVRHVMNYVEAVAGDLDEGRDGMAHSDSMDTCTDETAGLFNAAGEATIELLIASSLALSEEGDDPVVEVLETWLREEPGCTDANDYCGSKWVAVAREKPTGPYLETFLGCAIRTVEPRTPSAPTVALIGLLAFVGYRRRR